jgi:hypothetical protein
MLSVMPIWLQVGVLCLAISMTPHPYWTGVIHRIMNITASMQNPFTDTDYALFNYTNLCGLYRCINASEI